MTAAARAPSAATVLRTAAGEPPLGIGGLAFRDDQGEMFEHDNPRYRTPAARIGILELDDGRWLAHPPGFRADLPVLFESRETALRYAINEVVRRARRYMRNGEGEGTHWTEGYAGRVIEWALSLKPPRELDDRTILRALAAIEADSDLVRVRGPILPALVARKLLWEVPGAPGRYDLTQLGIDRLEAEKTGSKEISPPVNPNNVLGVKTVVEEITDPVVAELVAAHRARKVYPAGHTFSMTNPIQNGRMVTLGNCTCGDSFSYSWGSYERMDAAIEAHWQRFDHLPEKVDGRGNPIGTGDGAADPKKGARRAPGSRRASPKKSDTPELAETVPPEPASANAPCVDGAGSPSPKSHYERWGENVAATFFSYGAPEGIPAPVASAPLVVAPDGADAVVVEDAPIGAGSLAQAMAAEPEPDWSPLMCSALDLAWREPPQVGASLAALLDFSKVYGAAGEVERPVLRWHGGKWRLAPWVMGYFPEHRIYVEPFGGAGSILLRKQRVYAEVYNDLDDVVTNLFRVLRDEIKAAKLIEALHLTPFSRAEFKEARLEAEHDVECARHLIVRSFMGFGSDSGTSTGAAGFRANSNRSGTTPAHDWANYPDALPAIVDRLRGVIVEQRPAIDVMRQHDGEGTLHYVDPPYLPETRSPANKHDLKHRMYRHELTVDDHRELLAFLQTLRGFVVLSGYPSELYDDALPDWRRVTCAAHADGARERTEVLWINPACAAALDAAEPRLFDLATLDVANTPPPSDVAEAEAS